MVPFFKKVYKLIYTVLFLKKEPILKLIFYSKSNMLQLNKVPMKGKHLPFSAKAPARAVFRFFLCSGSSVTIATEALVVTSS